jgi:hypothetical protein
LRAAFPDQPLYLVKIDLQDYYPSIPHDVLLTVLQRFGLTERDLAFFSRFLAPLITDDAGGRGPMARGLPMGHTLSGVLAEFLMRLLELHVRQGAPVRIIRLVDDIFLLAPTAEAALSGFQRVEEFCTACGLQINCEKSGA